MENQPAKQQKGLEETVEPEEYSPEDKDNGDAIYYKPPEEEPDIRKKAGIPTADDYKEKYTGTDILTDAELQLFSEGATQKQREEVIAQRDKDIRESKGRFNDFLNKTLEKIAELKKNYTAPKIKTPYKNSAETISQLESIEAGKDLAYDPGSNKRMIDTKIEQIKQNQDELKKNVPKTSAADRTKAFVENIPEYFKNAFYNLIPFKGTYANYKTKKILRENPLRSDGTKHKAIIIEHGDYQTRGPGSRFGNQAFSELNYIPILVKGYRGEKNEKGETDINESVRRSYKEVDKFLSDVDMEPNDFESMTPLGHSAGANKVRAAISMPEIVKRYNIKRGYGLSPDPVGVEGSWSKSDNPEYLETKKKIIQMNEKVMDGVDYFVISGSNDGLVKPSDSVDRYAKQHYSIPATHFKLAGQNKEINNRILDIMKLHEEDAKRPEYMQMKHKAADDYYNEAEKAA